MHVAEVMTPDPFTATVRSSVGQVLRMLAEADVRHLPILDDHALVGIVSDRDLRAVAPRGLDALENPDGVQRALGQPISSVMNTDLIFVHPESELGEAADLMIEHKIGAVPVVEPDSMKLLGILSYVDVLRATREAL
jgi:CBS domain-containing protein